MKTWIVALALIVMVPACSGSGDVKKSSEAGEIAKVILSAARGSLGGVDAVESFDTIRAEARVEGPNSDFITIVWSARDGRVRMEQSGGLVLGAHPDGNWSIDSATGIARPLSEQMLAFLRGHELHAAVLVPETRYHSPEFSGGVEFGGQRALAVSLKDNLGETVFAYFSEADTLPLGFRMTQPDPDVVVTVSGWESYQNLLLFTRAIFSQADEEFRYEYNDIQLNDVPDNVFVPSSQIQD